MAKGLLSESDITKKKAKIADTMAHITGSISAFKAELDTFLTDEQIAEAAKETHRYASRLAMRLHIVGEPSLDNYERMSYDQKKALVRHAFAGKDSYGRFGVYVRKTENAEQPWTYWIRGNFVNPETVPWGIFDNCVKGRLPMEKEEAQFLLKINRDYSDENPLEVPIIEEETRSISS